MAEQVIIIGNGGAGLAMALALAKANHHVTIISAKQAPADRMLGGVQMAANGWSALRDLGCYDAVWQYAKRLELMRIMTLSHGHTLVSMPLDEAHQRQPYASVTRQGLIKAMSARTLASPLISHVTAEVMHIESHAKQAVVFDSNEQEYQADWVFGADGMMGLCRQYIDGGEMAKPKLASRTVHRFLVPLDHLPAVMASASTSVWLGREGHIVHYPLSNGMLNLVVITHNSINGRTNSHDSCWALAERLLDAHPSLDVNHPSLASDQAHMMALQSWPRCDSWVRDRVVVTGDSAHQMPPHLAQGTGQALIDAASLGRCLADGKTIADAIPLWAGQRMRRIRAVLASADQAGVVFAPPPLLSPIRDVMVGLGGMAVMPRILDKIWSDQL